MLNIGKGIINKYIIINKKYVLIINGSNKHRIPEKSTNYVKGDNSKVYNKGFIGNLDS